MELQQYWQIIWKRLWIPIFLVALVAGLSLLTAQPQPVTLCLFVAVCSWGLIT